MTGSFEYQLLLNIVRTSFGEGERKRLIQASHQHDVDWSLFYHYADLHRVLPRVYMRLGGPGFCHVRLPEEIRKKFEHFFWRNAAIKTLQRTRLEKALAFLNRTIPDVMVLKGSALDLVAPQNIWERSYGDVDLVLGLDEDQVARRETVLRFLGDFPGFEYDFLEHHDLTMNGVLKVDFNRIWQDSTQIEFRGHSVRVMSAEDMLIAACISSCRKRFARLKWIIAVAEIVENMGDLRWRMLARKSKEYGCENILYTGLFTTAVTTGCKLPNGFIGQLSVSTLKRGAIRLLTRRLTESSLSAGWRVPVIERNLGTSLLLPYVTYNWGQRIRKFREIGDCR